MKFWNIIRETIKDYLGKYSITRVSSYFLLATILFNSLVYISIDIVNAIQNWRNGDEYRIPWNHITIFSMILAHHLILLGLKKSNDSKAMEVMPIQGQSLDGIIEEAKQEVKIDDKSDNKTIISNITPDSPELPDDNIKK